VFRLTGLVRVLALSSVSMGVGVAELSRGGRASQGPPAGVG
jgi:hypothetical protein